MKIFVASCLSAIGRKDVVEKILMRLGKTPFDSFSPWETLRKNYIGGNNGNLIFGYAAHKLLSAGDNVVEANHYRISGQMADEVNANYSGFVLPLANAFRPSFRTELINTTQFINKLKIPFMMLSGGAQLPLDGDPASLKPIESEVKAFAAAVLDKSPKLSVRGELTAEYLNSLGIKDVEVIGCPSMTLLKESHAVTKTSLTQDSKIAFNIETSKSLALPLFEELTTKLDSVYFPQDRKTLEMMLWGSNPYSGSDSRVPLSRDHNYFQARSVEYMLDAPKWIERLKDFDFSVGPRIHGNIAALIAGTPAVVLVHDSRTLELAKYHGIPYVLVAKAEEDIAVHELYENADYSAFNDNHQRNKKKLLEFVKRCGFQHIYEERYKSSLSGYEQYLESQPLRPALSTVTVAPHAIDNDERAAAVNARLVSLEQQLKNSQAQSRKAIQISNKLKQQNEELSSRLRVVEDRVSIKANLKKLFRKK